MRRTGLLTTNADLVVRSWDAGLEVDDRRAADATRSAARCPNCVRRPSGSGILALLPESLATGGVTVLAPAIHHFLIACTPVEPCDEFDSHAAAGCRHAAEQRHGIVGLAISIEDVTARRGRRARAGARSARPDAEVRTARSRCGPVGTASTDSSRSGGLSRRRLAGAPCRRGCGRIGPDPELLQSIVAALQGWASRLQPAEQRDPLLALTGMDVADGAHRAAAVRGRGPARSRRRSRSARSRRGRWCRRCSPRSTIPTATCGFTRSSRSASCRRARGRGADRRASSSATTSSSRFLPSMSLVKIGEPYGRASASCRVLSDPRCATRRQRRSARWVMKTPCPLLAASKRRTLPVGAIVRALAAIHARYEETAGRWRAHRGSRAPHADAAGRHRRCLRSSRSRTGAELRAALLVLSWSSNASRCGGVERGCSAHASVPHDVIETLVRFGSPILDVLSRTVERRRHRHAARCGGGPWPSRRSRRRAGADRRTRAGRHRSLLAPICGALARLGDERAFEPLLAHWGIRIRACARR